MEEARFDDCTRGGRSFRLTGLADSVRADRPAEVRPALERLERDVAAGRWAGGYLAYEGAPGLDPTLAVRERSGVDPLSGMPLLWFGLFDRREDLAALAGLPEGSSDAPSSWNASIDRRTYDGAIDAIREHIAAGDTYQVNFSLRLRAPYAGDDRALYRELCLAQRGAHGARIDLERYRVLSASPELFFEVEGDRIVTRPMKGTAPRGRWPQEDRERVERLVASEKERAENAMIVDLLRNDLGRISVPGSVTVPAMYTPERYETVWQLTSTVTSALPPGTPIIRVLEALFPSGSVTGAPKIRSMQIIAELEDGPRGVYTGAVGYLAPPGASGPRAAFNVAIRTVVVDVEADLAEYGVGGGITHDSSAEAEYEECLTKARVLVEHRASFELLETIAYVPGEGCRRLEGHLRRLAASAEHFGFGHDEGKVRAALDRVVSRRGDRPARLRLRLGADGAVNVEVEDLPPPGDRAVRLVLDDDPVDPRDPMLFHKTTRRAPYERRAARHPAADDVVLVNDRGEVTETTIANLAVRLEGRWWTPPLDAGCMPGVERAALLADARLAERTISASELADAEGLAVVNSVRGWREAVLLDREGPPEGSRAREGSTQDPAGASSIPDAGGRRGIT